MNSLTSSFQARAATRPKPAVERVIICLTIARGRSLGDSGTSIFLATQQLNLILIELERGIW